MKVLIGIILVVVLATLIGIFMVKDPGYVLLAYHQWTLEMPLWLAIMLLFATMFVLRLIGRVLNHVFHFKQRATSWYQHRRRHRAQQDTDRGLLAYATQNWSRAEKYLTKAAPNATSPLMNYLISAQAAQQQHSDERRDQYLTEAQRISPQARFAIQLIQAQSQIHDQQYGAALTLLTNLPSSYAQHPKVLVLLFQIYQARGDWQQCAKLLPSLKNQAELSPATLQREELMVMQQLLQQAATREDQGSTLHRTWQQFTRSLQQEPLLVAEYVRGLLHYQQPDTAEYWLRNTIKLHPANAPLIDLYGRTHSRSIDKQLSIAKGWLKTTPHRAIVLLALGRLAIANELWGLARDYLTESLQLQPQPQTYCVFAQLLDQLGETALAYQYYRDGLTHAV